MKKVLIAGVVLALALVSLPNASFAYGGGSPVVTGTVAPSQVVTIDWPAGEFTDGELVTAAVTCTSGTATILTAPATPGVFRAYPAGTYYPATGSGALSLQVQLPAGDFGTCSCHVTGIRSSTTSTADLTYVPGQTVAYTGLNVGLFVWTGAGVVALGLALVIVMAARRRSAAKLPQ